MQVTTYHLFIKSKLWADGYYKNVYIDHLNEIFIKNRFAKIWIYK